MHIVHGTWIPDDTDQFVQRGAFYVWVETDTPLGTTRHRAGSDHPRHLTRTALATFLTEKLGVRESVPDALARTLCTKHFVLPTAAGRPLPSVELVPYVEEEVPLEYDIRRGRVAPGRPECSAARRVNGSPRPGVLSMAQVIGYWTIRCRRSGSENAASRTRTQRRAAVRWPQTPGGAVRMAPR